MRAKSGRVTGVTIIGPAAVAEAVSVDQPEFNDPPAPVGYSSDEFPGHYQSGQLSPWGEQLLFSTDYCGKHKCVTSGHMSVRMKEWVESHHGYKDNSLQDFLKCMKAADRSVELCGADDDRGM